MEYKYAVGRRKTSSAALRLYRGKAQSTVNGKDLEKYFPIASQQQEIMQPLTLLGLTNNFHFTAKVVGGGVTGQAGAVMLALARSLVKEEEANKSPLKKEKLLTRDDRMVERKKTGQPKARKKPQFSKR